MQTIFMLLLLAPLVTSFNRRFQQRSSILQQFQDLLDDEQESYLSRRNHHYKNDEDSDEIDSNRRVFDKDNNQEESYLELRATSQLNQSNTEMTITLQNHAAMNTRLRVLYINSDGNPTIAETGLLLAGQSKSVKLPAGSKNIHLIVQKDIFFENWRVAYDGVLSNDNQCIRIVGVTLFSKIHQCKN